MNGKLVFQNGIEKMTGVIAELLEKSGLEQDDIDLIVPHQPNLRMLEEIIARSGIPQEKFFINVKEYGNMASATLPIALDQARRSGRIAEEDLVLLVGFGAGFSWGAALVRMCTVPRGNGERELLSKQKGEYSTSAKQRKRGGQSGLAPPCPEPHLN
jgi:3-oxoacyl-[acyl-carrier-protein] synthase-3